MGSVEAAREIKEKARAMGAKAVGIASVDAINRIAPPGHKPSDLLKGARSVVVLGGGEPTAGAWRTGTNRVLGSIGYNRSQLASAARQLSYFIEERYGYYTIPIPSGDWIGHYPYMSLKVCAEMAGLGTRSMAAGILLNPQYGLLYFNGVITTLPLPEDGPLENQCARMILASVCGRRNRRPRVSLHARIAFPGKSKKAKSFGWNIVRIVVIPGPKPRPWMRFGSFFWKRSMSRMLSSAKPSFSGVTSPGPCAAWPTRANFRPSASTV
jgi:hypothetical protein